MKNVPGGKWNPVIVYHLLDDGYAHFSDEVLKDNPLYAGLVFYDMPRSGIVGVRYEAGLVVEEVREVHVDRKSVHEVLKQSTGTSQWKRKGELPGQWEIYTSNDGKFVAYVSPLYVPWDVKPGNSGYKVVFTGLKSSAKGLQNRITAIEAGSRRD